ncbi:MAG: type II toxin-antitoxin system PemK/MazF family toxin [Spirochaetaceae bacterium]|jgi:mRNA interferase MazF|nr:type II toxin-antitoxin system PemK/MazF family toxin [Spirochaetaceae bacterium]
MKRGEVWWVDFEPALGSEIQKTRPAVIVSRDTANSVMRRVVVVPLTSNISRIYPAETVVTVRGVQSKALADQITVADKRRLKKQAGELAPEDMQKVDAVIRLHLDL